MLILALSTGCFAGCSSSEPESAEIPTGLIEPGVVRIKAMNSDEYLLFTFNPECGVTYNENLDLFSADTDGEYDEIHDGC